MSSFDQFVNIGASSLDQTMSDQEDDDIHLGYNAVRMMFPDECDEEEDERGRGNSARSSGDMFAVDSIQKIGNVSIDHVFDSSGGSGKRKADELAESDEPANENSGWKDSSKQLREISDEFERPSQEGTEYDVLDDMMNDDLNSSGEEKGWGDSEDEEDADEYDEFNVPEDEIDALLDEKLDEYREKKRARREEENEEMAHEEREKVVLKVRGQDHFEILPEGWIEVTHNSGMPIYLHKKSRVCTLSKPYFLGPGSARKHEAPIAAIPCLQYRREIEKERQKQLLLANPPPESQPQTCPVNGNISTEGIANIDDLTRTDTTATKETPTEEVVQIDEITCTGAATSNENPSEEVVKSGEVTCSGTIATEDNSAEEVVKTDEVTCSETKIVKKGPNLLNAKIETVQENTKEKSIDYLELRNYCQKLFEFKTIKVRRFKTWAGRRKHQKKMKQMHRPTLPLGTKLITCPLPPVTDKEEGPANNPRRAEFVMNPNGKSYVCILHEYVQHAMRVQPRYLFRELDNSSAPYGASVVINDMEYGFGFGGSKKQAKLDAAKATLEILIPQMKYINPDEKDPGLQQQDLALFDEIRVEDPRVSELCAKAGQPSPYQVLLECLKRNYGLGDTQVKFEMQVLKHQKNEFTMTVGKHSVSVVCKNKRDGKQRASQGILQLLHTHINSWGSLLRLYGKGSCKSLKEKKLEEQQITELQCRTTANKPNQSILLKLRVEMLKLKEKQNERKPIGKFVPTDIEPPSTSGSNLRNVDLW